MRLNTAGPLGFIKGRMPNLGVWGDDLLDSFHPFDIWAEKASHGLERLSLNLTEPRMIHPAPVWTTVFSTSNCST